MHCHPRVTLTHLWDEWCGLPYSPRLLQALCRCWHGAGWIMRVLLQWLIHSVGKDLQDHPVHMFIYHQYFPSIPCHFPILYLDSIFPIKGADPGIFPSRQKNAHPTEKWSSTFSKNLCIFFQTAHLVWTSFGRSQKRLLKWLTPANVSFNTGG